MRGVVSVPMSKNKLKPHKGLLKRVRITKSGKIKLRRACGRHLRSHKTGQAIRGYRVPKFADACDARRLRKMLGLPTGGTRPTPKTPTEPSKQAAEGTAEKTAEDQDSIATPAEARGPGGSRS